MLFKRLLLYGSIAGLIGAGITIYSLTVKNNKIKADLKVLEKHYEAQIEILKHPKEKTDEQKEVVKIVYKDKKGDPVIVERVVTRTVSEKEPVVLERPSLERDTIRRWYLSGCYGFTTGNTRSWGVACGYTVFDAVAVGVRYDTDGAISRIGVETLLRF